MTNFNLTTWTMDDLHDFLRSVDATNKGLTVKHSKTVVIYYITTAYRELYSEMWEDQLGADIVKFTN